MDTPLIWVVPFSGVLALAVAGYFAWDVLRSPVGTPEMQRVAGLIYVAAVAFIRRQYRTIALLALGGAVLIGAVVYFFEHVEGITSAELAIRTAVAFLVGAVASMLSGIIGMFVAVKSNLRTSAAAQHSIGDALRISCTAPRLVAERPHALRDGIQRLLRTGEYVVVIHAQEQLGAEPGAVLQVRRGE